MADDIEQHLSLAGEFPPTTRDDWMGRVATVLARALPHTEPAEAYERLLTHETEDGIRLQPLYTADDPAPEPGLPGFAPFVRSARPAATPWEIRQRVGVGDAVTELEGGATGILVEVGDPAAIAATLANVYLDLAPVSLVGGGSVAARTLLDLWEQRGVAPADRRGTLGVDPFGDWLRTGGSGDLAGGLDEAATLVDIAAEAAPRARVLVADGTLWHDAGATDAQELAWTIATAVATLRALGEHGVSAERAFAGVEFRLAATADQFATIAKLRAARRLWARIGTLTGVAGAPMYQHVETSRAMLTRYDPWVNVLRSTVAAFAAATGAADAVTVTPHDLRLGGSPLGRRIARNTQLILQEEAHLGRVIDPAGGSWYVESRTHDVAAAAWSLLRSVEGAGGMVAAVEAGTIHRALAESRARRHRDVATRRRPITGVSEFPNLSEEPPPEPPPPTAPTGTTPFEPFVAGHWSDPFEAQRARADRHTAATGQRPTVFVATLGSPADHTPRLTFATNLLAAGGIAVTVGDPTAADTTVACLCSSDARYRDEGAGAVDALRAAGVDHVLVAGAGSGLAVDAEMRAGGDALATITRTLDALGVAP